MAGRRTVRQHDFQQTAIAGAGPASASSAKSTMFSNRAKPSQTIMLTMLRSMIAPLAIFATLSAAPAAFAQTVMLSTSMGDIVLELDAAKAPKSVENFLQYVKSKHYNGTVFHRVIDNFMIQGGGMTANLSPKPTRAPIPLESKNGLVNDRGTVAMARTSVPNSATSQFFINLKNNDFLNSANSPDGTGYAVFGRVISGMDVVDKIAAVETQAKGGQQSVPVKTVTITEAVVQQ